MKQIIKILLSSIVLLLLISCSTNNRFTQENNSYQMDKTTDTLNVSAASSLTEALLEMKPLYERRHQDQLQLNFGSTGKLAKQMEHGAPVDVFISADEQWMEKLIERQLIDRNSVMNISKNSLVIIQHHTTNFHLDALEKLNQLTVDRIAIGYPESVPAGNYAKESLVEAQVWDELSDTFIFAQSVRQVLTYVETKNVDIGFVYESDAIVSEDVEILYHIPSTMHNPILYEAAIAEQSEQRLQAKQFIKFLQTDEAKSVFEKYGFNP